MTTTTVLAAMLARWPLTLLGLALTVLGVHQVASAPGLYYGQVAVHFLAPASARDPNRIQTETISLIRTAGIVKTIVNEGHRTPGESLALTLRTTDPASSVSLPNAGSQWIDIYSKPMLLVEATGPDPESVLRRIAGSEGRIRETLAEVQDREQVDAEHRIALATAPEVPVVSHLLGARNRAAAAAGLLGLALTVWLTCEVDRRLRRRPGARPDRRASPPRAPRSGAGPARAGSPAGTRPSG